LVAIKLAEAVVSSVVALVLAPIVTSAWNLVAEFLKRPDLILPWEAALLVAGVIVVAAYAGRRFASVSDLLEQTWIWISYAARMLPFWVREIFALGHPGSGRRNRRFKSEAAFFAASRTRHARAA